MDTKNWVAVDKSIAQTDFWLAEPFSLAQSWVDLLLVSEADTTITSIRKLSSRWQWSRSKVSRFLERLFKEGRIALKITNQSVTIIVQREEKRATSNEKKEPLKEPLFIDASTGREKAYKIESEKKSHLESHLNHEKRATPDTVKIEVEEFFDRWNKFAKKAGLKTAIKITDKRRQKIAAMLLSDGWFDHFMEAVKKLPLKRDGGWQPDLDWIINKEDNVLSIIEGKFDWLEKKTNQVSDPRGNIELAARLLGENTHDGGEFNERV